MLYIVYFYKTAIIIKLMFNLEKAFTKNSLYVFCFCFFLGGGGGWGGESQYLYTVVYL